MYRKAWLPLILVLAIALVGCGGTPSTPTKPPATTAPQVITVVVTAPPPPTIPALPTITPMPTVALTVTTPIVVSPTGTVVTPRPTGPTATRRPAATPTATALRPSPTAAANKYKAPILTSPLFDPGGRKDQLVVGSALVFEWQSVGPLGEGECYRIRLDLNPGGGDSYLQCSSDVTGAGVGQPVRYVLQRPGFGGLTYSSLLGRDVSTATASWYVDVVKDDGTAATGPIAPDGIRHKVTALSPKSTTFSFPVYGNQ